MCINFKKRYKYKAFTLAEVLITLLIIGVVSSLVIPAIINDTQEAEYKAAWKKVYADLSQATTLLLNDNASDFTGIFTNTNILRDSYLQHLSYSKKCDYAANTAGNCWVNDGIAKLLNGNAFPYSSSGTAGAVLNNGVLLKFETNGSDTVNCIKIAWWGNMPKCGIIHVDVNGFKAPNMLGKDIYFIQIVKNGIKPMGTIGDSNENTCNITSGSVSGWGCAAKYLYQ
jgi:prepilin-type N-terminal cleavage/methylation domain-containing protein